jgi:hypothetical protein
VVALGLLETLFIPGVESVGSNTEINPPPAGDDRVDKHWAEHCTEFHSLHGGKLLLQSYAYYNSQAFPEEGSMQ